MIAMTSKSAAKQAAELRDTLNRANRLYYVEQTPEMSDAECNLDYFMDEVIIAGDPAEVTRRLIELREKIGDFGTLVLVAHDWDDRKQWLHNLDLFAQEVIPALNKHNGGSA